MSEQSEVTMADEPTRIGVTGNIDSVRNVVEAALEHIDAGEIADASLLLRRAAVALDLPPDFIVECSFNSDSGPTVRRFSVIAQNPKAAQIYAEEEVRALYGSALHVDSVVVG